MCLYKCLYELYKVLNFPNEEDKNVHISPDLQELNDIINDGIYEY
jgi:hypothetical protein